DESARMLEFARARDPNIHWIQGDMRAPPVQGEFDLVICPFNTLQWILTDADLLRTFRAVRNLLNPEGLFVFDLYQPNLEYLKSPPTDQVVRLFFDQQGRYLEVGEDARYDPAALILSLDWRVLDRRDPQALPLGRLDLRLRQYFANDIERL